MILVAMTSRSGSSMVCRVLAEHGLRWQDGGLSPRQPSMGKGASAYDSYEHLGIKRVMKMLTPAGKWPLGDSVNVTNRRLNIMRQLEPMLKSIDFAKVAIEFIPLWLVYWDTVHCGEPLHVIKVYRPPEAVADSLTRRRIGSWFDGYHITQKRYKLMEEFEGLIVATPLLVAGQFVNSGMRDAVQACHIKWDVECARRAIEKEKFHA